MKKALHLWLWTAVKLAAIIALFAIALSLTSCGYGKTCMNERFTGYGHSEWKKHTPKPVKQ